MDRTIGVQCYTIRDFCQTVEDFDAFQRISFELTQSICLRIEQELAAIKKKG